MGKNKKRIIVIGAGGQLGSEILKCLPFNKYQITAVSHKKDIPFKINGLKKISGDVTKIDKKFKLEIKNADIIIDLAAKLAMFDKDSMMVNYEGLKNVLKFVKKNKKVYFIFMSSSEAFGTTKIISADENDFAMPYSIYGKSKLLAEKEIIKFSKKNEFFNYLILRPSIITYKDNWIEKKFNYINNEKKIKNYILRSIFYNDEINSLRYHKVIEVIIKLINNPINNKVRFLSGQIYKIKPIKIKLPKIFEKIIMLIMKILNKGGFYLNLGLKSKKRNYRRYSNKIYKEIVINE